MARCFAALGVSDWVKRSTVNKKELQLQQNPLTLKCVLEDDEFVDGVVGVYARRVVLEERAVIVVVVVLVAEIVRVRVRLVAVLVVDLVVAAAARFFHLLLLVVIVLRAALFCNSF